MAAVTDERKRQHKNTERPIVLPRDARLDALAKMEAQVLALERDMGTTHPHVGKAWLALSRAYQKMASPAHNKRAERALVR